MKLKVKADIKKNRIHFTFAGKVSRQEMEKLYTDTRFCVADMKPGFDVIADYSDCFLLHLSGIRPFRKIMNYLITNNVGEIVRIVNKQSLLYKQIMNLSSAVCGYRPIYVSTHEEAEKELANAVKRDGIRFHVNNLPVEFIANNDTQHGKIKNISTSGCSIEAKSSLFSIGDTLVVTIKLDINDSEQEEFKMKSRIVRASSEAIAVKFEDLDGDQKVNLWKCLVRESNREI